MVEVTRMVFPMHCPECEADTMFMTLLPDSDLRGALNSDSSIVAVHAGDGEHRVILGAVSRKKLADSLNR